jgi:hypothetical protein
VELKFGKGSCSEDLEVDFEGDGDSAHIGEIGARRYTSEKF